MSLQNWEGARWWKCDLHTHTPASGDYGKGPSQAKLQQIEPREWLLGHMRADIDCVAVTDHNRGTWIDRLRSALVELKKDPPDDYRPLHLFPGVEISVQGGVHLLAILGSKSTTSDIDRLLGAVDFGESKDSSSEETTKSFTDVVKAIVRSGGIAIPAHVDGERGLFKMLAGSTLDQALNCDQIFAMETVNSSCIKPQLYHDKKLRWTEILGSDSHHPSGEFRQGFPGSHFTWVKMGNPNLEGLRLALLDGNLSVRRSDDFPKSPNHHNAGLMLESIEISAAKYFGRENPFEVNLNPWLNAIIGGRGTGKSSLVEFLRIALRREHELPDELKGEFAQYSSVYRSREDSGLLTDDAKICVIYRKDESRFRLQWSQTGNVGAIEQDENGAWVQAEGDVVRRFPIRIYSQKQIFHLAKTPSALLKVVDEAWEVERQSLVTRRRQETSRFLSLKSKIREIEAELPEESRLRGELDDVVRKLAIFEADGHADVLKSFQKHSLQHRAIENWQATWSGGADRLRSIGTDFVPDALGDSRMDTVLHSDMQLLARANKARVRLEAIRRKIEEIAEEADQILAEWRTDLAGSPWQHASNEATRAYEVLREQLKAEGGDPMSYGELVRRRQVIEQQLDVLKDRKHEVAKLKTRASAILRRLLESRRELTTARESFLNRILENNTYVRIRVIPYGGRETVESEFRNLIQADGQRFEKDIGCPDGGGLVGSIYSSEQDATRIEDALNTAKQKIRSVADGSHISEKLVVDQRFANHLSKLHPEVLDRLDAWFPEDALDVRYSPTGDGQKLQSITLGSPGQKTAALLAFLLSYGDEPLILDQPEDDLDNHLIYELIVKQIREVKQRRQIVVVTHNPNIVVNGDAELVVAFGERNGGTQKECNGSLQDMEVRQKICAIMEGGRDAFEERYRRIALEGLGD